MSTVFRNNGLSLVLVALFVISTLGMTLAGHGAFNERLLQHDLAPVGLWDYLATGDFLSALFENWESEFLQMSVYVVLTAILFQRGSAESRDPDDPGPDDPGVPWRRRHPAAAWLYEHSLGLTLALLFVVSFLLHWYFSLVASNEEASQHGAGTRTLAQYLIDPQLWFESFQNWQSEFLSTAVLVVLSIFLRHKGSPESKPVLASNTETGD